jgi:hypothetical protein
MGIGEREREVRMNTANIWDINGLVIFFGIYILYIFFDEMVMINKEGSKRTTIVQH